MRLRKDKDVAITALKQNKNCLEYIDEELQKDEDIQNILNEKNN